MSIPHSHLRQEDFLYSLNWDARVDNLFAEVLYDQAQLGNFVPNGDNSDAISTAQYVVNKMCGKSFDYNFCARQIRKMKKRHRVFGWLIRLQGVQYDEATNRVHANPNIWPSILAVDDFAQAYDTFGDPCWKELKTLFGPPPDATSQLVRFGQNEDVVVVSSDSSNIIRAPRQQRKKKYSLIDEDVDVQTSSGGSFWNELTNFHDLDSDSETSPSWHSDLSNPSNQADGGTPTKGPPPSWNNVSPWK